MGVSFWNARDEMIRGKWKPIYLMMGTEDYLADELVRILREKFLEPASNHSCQRIEGDGYSVVDLVRWAESPRLFRDRQLLILDDSTHVSKDMLHINNDREEEFLEKWLKQDDFSTIIVLKAEKIDRRKKIIKLMERAKALIELAPLKGENLRRWVKERVKLQGKTLNRDVMEQLILYIGEDLRRLDSEIYKLVTYAGKGRGVNAESVSCLITQAVEGNVFKLTDSLGEKQLALAFKHLERLFQQNEPPLRILGMISRQVRLLISAKLMLLEGRIENMSGSLKVPSFVARKLASQAGNFDLEELYLLMEKVREADENIKTGRYEPKMALELLIANIIAKEQPSHGSLRY